MVGTYVDDCLIAAESPSLLEEITYMISSKFSIKTVAVMQGDIFDADVLGIDLRYDRKRGTVSLSLETYIDTMVKTFYSDIVNTKKVTEVPHVSTYDLNPLTDPLDLPENELKREVNVRSRNIVPPLLFITMRTIIFPPLSSSQMENMLEIWC